VDALLRARCRNVSRHVAALEKSLGTRLLHRSTRQMVATAEGQRYYAQARQALDIIGEAEAEVHGEQDPHGLLRIACPESIGTELLIPALPDFLQRYPHVDVECHRPGGRRHRYRHTGRQIT
jgi:LysR family transcriptional regulator for bpeEF and oprC